MEAESLPELSPTSTSELSALARRAFSTEFLQLEHPALHTDLAELPQEDFKEVSLLDPAQLCLKDGSFSLSPGVAQASHRLAPRGSAKSPSFHPSQLDLVPACAWATLPGSSLPASW